MTEDRAYRSIFQSAMKWRPIVLATSLLAVFLAPLHSQTVVGQISKPGMKPTAIAVYEKGRKLLIADKKAKEILVYNETTLKQVGSINLGPVKLSNIIIDEKYGKAYCLGESPDWMNETIVVIDVKQNNYLREIELPFQRTYASMVHDPNLHKVYGLSVGGLIQIDVATDSVTKIPGISGNAMREIAINPVTHDVYISNSQYHAFDIINGVTLAHSKILNLTGVGLGVNYNENKVYIGCFNWFTGVYRLGVYDHDTGKHMPLNPPNDALCFAFNPNSNRMYTSSELAGVTSIIEGATDKVFNMPLQSPAGPPIVRYATNHVYYTGMDLLAKMDYIAILNDNTQLVEIIPGKNENSETALYQDIAINQETGRVYIITDEPKQAYITVIQDEEPMSRPPVYLGKYNNYAYNEIEMFDPRIKSSVGYFAPSGLDLNYHVAAFKPGGGRYYIPVVDFNWNCKIAEFAGFSGFEYQGGGPLIKEIKTEGKGSKVPVVSPDGNTIYVTNSDSNDVSVINADLAELETMIVVGRSPLGMDITQDGKKLLVANKDDDTISVIDARNNSETTRIDFGDSPWGVTINPSGRWAYIANNGSNTVSVVNIKKASVFTEIPVGSGPRWLTCSPEGKYVWVSNSSDYSISIIDTSSYKVVNTISLEKSPEGICCLPDGSEVYIATGSDLTVISTSKFNKTTFQQKRAKVVSVAVGDPNSRFAGFVKSAGGPLRGVGIQAFRERVKKGKASTNLHGDYCIHNLPPGKYKIKITKPGYVSKTRKLEVQAGQMKILNVKLKKS